LIKYMRRHNHPLTICHSSSATVTTERDHGARGTTIAEGASQGNDERVGGGGGEGPVDVRAIDTAMPLLIRTAATERDRDARRTTSAGGGEGPPAPHRRGHLLMRGHRRCHCHSSLATAATKRDTRAIDLVSAAIERNSSARGTTSARGEGGARGRPRHNASAAR
jgi:hypothetical protein